MNELMTFDYSTSLVRTVMRDDDPWFVATDVAAILGYAAAKDMTRNLDDDEKGKQIVPTLGGDQELTIISESGLYNAIFRSRRKEAQAFRRWVTGTMLPQIRREGRYQMSASALSDPRRLIAATRAVDAARRVYGRAGAEEVWRALGLPPVSHRSLPERTIDPDLSERVAGFLSDRNELTIAEVIEFLGVKADQALRRQIGAILRMLGYDGQVQHRRGAGTVFIFTRVEG